MSAEVLKVFEREGYCFRGRKESVVSPTLGTREVRKTLVQLVEFGCHRGIPEAAQGFLVCLFVLKTSFIH